MNVNHLRLFAETKKIYTGVSKLTERIKYHMLEYILDNHPNKFDNSESNNLSKIICMLYLNRNTIGRYLKEFVSACFNDGCF